MFDKLRVALGPSSFDAIMKQIIQYLPKYSKMFLRIASKDVWCAFPKTENFNHAIHISLRGIVINGDLDVLKYAYHICKWPVSDGMLYLAARCGHLNMLKWLQVHIYGYVVVGKIVEGAVMRGRIHIIEYCVAQKFEMYDDMPSIALSYGQRNVLEWLIIHDYANKYDSV